MSKNSKFSLKGAALAVAGVAVAATLVAGQANAAGGGFSASDGQWQQTLDRAHAAFGPTHAPTRSIAPPVTYQPNVPR
jgi:hypothetical protein